MTWTVSLFQVLKENTLTRSFQTHHDCKLTRMPAAHVQVDLELTITIMQPLLLWRFVYCFYMLPLEGYLKPEQRCSLTQTQTSSSFLPPLLPRASAPFSISILPVDCHCSRCRQCQIVLLRARHSQPHRTLA